MKYTRTLETEALYRSRGDALVQKYRAKIEADQLDPVSFATWLIARRPSLSASTWRTYRQSALNAVSASDHPKAALATSILKAASNAAPSGRKVEPDKPKHTSAAKAKNLPYSDYEKLITYLKFMSKSRLWPTARAWIIAGLATGLRPAEWCDTEIIENESDRQIQFRVRNAKVTNDRGNGSHRTMNITSFQPDTIKAIRYMSTTGAQWHRDGRYPEMQAQVSQLLYKTSEQINTKHDQVYCLYSLRHQFTANMKSLKDRREVAALLGHRVTRTASENYGKRRSAWSPEHVLDIPIAMESEVETVTDNARRFEDSPISARKLAA